eukprot:TRINITY_DN18838_c0_g2_i1.p1 TRINITY_DN18838_c0_g2~~TRINITY_DN18838_c0_g2_i1.p1  ORF type:complete len:299 (+),score=99.09 TRINITY_DN18838_c0_g2_i1:197-1093(+)
MQMAAKATWLALLLAAHCCTAVEVGSTEGFQLVGDHFHPSQDSKVDAMDDILEQMDSDHKLSLLTERVHELDLKNHLKDEQIASLKLSHQSHHNLGESNHMDRHHHKHADVPSPVEDDSVLQNLPEDVRDEVTDFYSHGGEDLGENGDEDSEEDEEGVETSYMASSGNSWKMTKRSDLKSDTLTDEFPATFGTTTIAENNDLGESGAVACDSPSPKELCLDDEATHKWIQYSVDNACGARLCAVGDGQQRVCLSKSSHTTAFQANCHATGKSYSIVVCLLYTSPSPRDRTRSRMPSSA